MGDKTGIQWCDATWNPLYGCSAVSKGCQLCYATRSVLRFQDKFGGDLVRISGGKPVWTGRVALAPDRLTLPLRWQRPRRVFVASLSDVFHEAVPDKWIDRIFAVMALSPRHTFQLLTKRPERMRDYCCTVTLSRLMAASEAMPAEPVAAAWPLPNVWLGTSVENQETADERIPLLLETPAAVRFVSAEPLLAPVRLDALDLWGKHGGPADSLRGVRAEEVTPGVGDGYRNVPTGRLDWLILGGESGPGARPFVLGWGKDIVRQCRAAGVACFVKQVGSRPVNREGERCPHIKDRKGGDVLEWPEELRVREYPAEASA